MRAIRSLLHRPLGVLAVLTLLAGIAAACYAVAPVAEPGEAADLDGKVLYIVPRNRSWPAPYYSIEKTKVRRSGGRMFLVGTVIDPYGRKPRTLGSTLWVAMDEVEAIYPFRSVQEMRKGCPHNPYEAVPAAWAPAPAVPVPIAAPAPPPPPKKD
jgi:hypothetical protein